jgi:hypothetical protein
MKITIEISDDDAKHIKQFLDAAPDQGSHGKLTMKTLAQMLMQDVALAVRRPGSWEGANMDNVLLRILVSLDLPDLTAAGVMRAGDHNAWGTFRRDPFRWFIRADDETACKVWTLIERRHEPMFKVTEAHRIDDEAAP